MLIIVMGSKIPTTQEYGSLKDEVGRLSFMGDLAMNLGIV